MNAIRKWLDRRYAARVEAERGAKRQALEHAAFARKLAFCTIATRAFVPWSLVLFEALREHHPNAERVLLYVREPEEAYRLPVIEGVKVIGLDALVSAEVEAMLRRRYGLAELCFALKARLLRYCLDHHGERAIYLDSDIDVRGPLKEALYALEEGSVVLTPHLDAPIPMDGKVPSNMTILRAGVYNAGFVAVAEREETRRMLDWWDERVARWGFLAPEAGYQGDQKWLDLAPSLFPGTRALRDPGSNVGAWNLHSRQVTGIPGALRVNGVPLAFLHFSGFDPERPHVLSRYQDRHDPADHRVLMDLAHEFAGRVLAAAARAETLEWRPVAPPSAPEPETRTPRPDMMPADAYRARIEAVRSPEGILSAGEELVLDVTVTNISPHRWDVARNDLGEGGIALSWHLLDAKGAMLVRNHPRSWLARDVGPGESIRMTLGIRVPTTPGIWRMELDLVHEGFTWFADQGSRTGIVEVAVDAALPAPGDPPAPEGGREDQARP